MSPDEFRTALDELNLSRREAAQALGVSNATVRHWLSGRHSIPGPAVRLLRLWIRMSALRPPIEDDLPTEELVR